jgi:hypothetical protein
MGDSFWTIAAFFASAVVALGTSWLAVETRRLARQTAQEVGAQWRPVVIAVHDARLTRTKQATSSYAFRLTLANDGGGPALNAGARLTFADNESGQEIWLGVVRSRAGTAIAVPCDFSQIDIPPLDTRIYEFRVKVWAEDVAGTVYETTLTYDVLPDARGRADLTEQGSSVALKRMELAPPRALRGASA